VGGQEVGPAAAAAPASWLQESGQQMSAFTVELDDRPGELALRGDAGSPSLLVRSWEPGGCSV